MKSQPLVPDNTKIIDVTPARKQWLIYGAHTTIGKKILNEAIRLGYTPVLAGTSNQECVELSFQTGLASRIFALSEIEKIKFFLRDVCLVVLCEDLTPLQHRKLLRACLLAKTHYLDTSNDLFSYERVLRFAPKFQAADVTALPGLHPTVLLGDFVASILKSHLTDATDLMLACSESFSSVSSLLSSMLSGGRVLVNGRLRKPVSAANTMLVPFNDEQSLSISSPQADILSAWQSTRIPNVTTFRKSTAKEIRFLRFFHFLRWLFHIPFIKNWLRSQDNFLIKHFALKPYYPVRYAVWGKASNPQNKSLTLRLEIINDFDVSLDVPFKFIESLLNKNMRGGVLTASQALGTEYWKHSEHFSLKAL